MSQIKVEAIKNCLLGGAIGDALGYPVEFLTHEKIKERYGEQGINFDNFSGKPIISDDTQMTLFTANGILLKGNTIENIWNCYQDWLDTQFKNDKSEMSHEPVSWLVDNPEMFANREPGRTCLQALYKEIKGNLIQRTNDSKGCGAVMRIAPIGLLPNITDEKVINLAAECSALTHGHQMSILSSVFMAELVHQGICQNILGKAILDTLRRVKQRFKYYTDLNEFEEKILTALKLVSNHEEDAANIEKLGQGWVAEEALGIALYCSCRYKGNASKALEVAVNHNGDSDSTGSITGQILGVFISDWIPKQFAKNIELRNVIEETAQQLANIKLRIE